MRPVGCAETCLRLVLRAVGGRRRSTFVPVGLSALKKLKFLRLGRNQIVSHGTAGTCFPELDASDAFKDLKYLDSNLLFLDLRQNRVDWIPSEICLLSSLTHLDLSTNHISMIPGEVTSLAALRTFKVDRNRFRSIPTSISEMPWLREFSCKDNILIRRPSCSHIPSGNFGVIEGRSLVRARELAAPASWC